MIDDRRLPTLPPSGSRPADVLERVLGTARADDYSGYSKHDALNAPWLERLAGRSRHTRLLSIQTVMRSPVDIRPLLGVHKARNAKGLSLFARALLARHRLTQAASDATEARLLLDWLLEHSASGFAGLSWGYPYPWQDVGFFAPRNFPNRVVTSFVGQALLDGYETLGESRYLQAAGEVVEFLLTAPKTLYEDPHRRCVSYVPDLAVKWIVLDVPALVGAFAARYGALAGDSEVVVEGARLVRYVVSKQTEYGAWYYTEPPSDSHITHDNYHTGFILDAIQQYGRSAGSDEFEGAYRRGVEFYQRRLFETDGAARFMDKQHYPVDIHGCAQGIITFSLQQRHSGTGGDMAQRVLKWTLDHMWDPRSGWFYYQKRRLIRTSIRELRWCQGWMAWALATYLETCDVAA